MVACGIAKPKKARKQRHRQPPSRACSCRCRPFAPTSILRQDDGIIGDDRGFHRGLSKDDGALYLNKHTAQTDARSPNKFINPAVGEFFKKFFEMAEAHSSNKFFVPAPHPALRAYNAGGAAIDCSLVSWCVGLRAYFV